MEYRIRYNINLIKDLPDFTSKIDAKNDNKAIQKAKDFIEDRNRNVRKKGSKYSYKLIGVDRIKQVKIMITEEKFIPLSLSK